MSPVRLSLCVAIVFLQVEFASGYEPLTTDSEYNRFLAELESDTSIEFVDVSLAEALERIAAQHNFNVVVDGRSIRSAQPDFDLDARDINLIISNIRLRSALQLLLEPLQLDYTIEDEVLKITTPEKVLDGKPQTRGYVVSELLNEGGEVNSLAEAIHAALPVEKRRIAGVSGYRNLLLVTGNRGVHESVRKTLRIISAGVNEQRIVTPTAAAGQRLNRRAGTVVSSTQRR